MAIIEKTIMIGNIPVKVKQKTNDIAINNTKYESYIRVGHNGSGSYGNYSCSDLQDFPVATTMTRRLHDVDKDAFTDLRGFTHRNRVRHDVEDFDLGFAILNDEDEAKILNLISPEWFYVELTDKKTHEKKIHKMYASDKEWNVYKAWVINGEWYEANQDFSVSFVEE